MLTQHRRLKIKLLAVQLISIIPFLLFIFYLFDIWYDTRRSSVIEQNLNQAKMIASFLHSGFVYAQETAKVLTNDKHLQKLLGSDINTSRQVIKNLVDQASEIDNIAITDNFGTPIVSTTDLSDLQLKNITFADREYFQQALKSKKTAFSSPLVGKLTGNYILTVAAPILSGNEVAYVVVLAIDINRLKEKIDQFLPEDKDKFIYILDSNRQIVWLNNQPLPVEKEKSLMADLPSIKKAQTEKMVVIENQLLPFSNDKSMMGGAVSINNSGWVVASVEPVDHIFSPILKLQSVVWLILISAMIFSVSILSYFLRKVKIAF